jgi:putative colanic acid biosynthesis UDP-glucose lipid carrier transferase
MSFHASGTGRGFLRTKEELLTAFQRLADFLAIGLAHYLACGYFKDTWRPQMTAATAISLVVFNLLAEWRGLYRPWRSERIARELSEAATAWLAVPVVLFTLGFITKTSVGFSRAVSVVWFVSTPLLLSVWRLGARLVLRYMRARGRNSRNVAILGATKISEQLCESVVERPWLGMRLVGLYDDRAAPRQHKFARPYCDFAGSVDQLVEDARSGAIDIIYIGLPLRAEGRIGDTLKALADTTATVFLAADFFTYDLMHSRWHQLADIPVVSIYDSPFDGVAGWLKRAEDLVLGSFILMLIAVPMLLVAMAIKLTSPGPVLFRQRRFGLNAREIRVLKFRTMTVCEDGDSVRQAVPNDPRVTRLGRFLRRTSMDELPQFLQVLTGEMSIVGPRPHAVAHNQAYRTLIQGYMLRHKVKPGITGWAQVNGFRGETDTLEKMQNRIRYDLDYIKAWYLWLDLKIIFLTVFGSKKNLGAH